MTRGRKIWYGFVGLFFAGASVGWVAGISTAISRSQDNSGETSEGDFSWKSLSVGMPRLVKRNPEDPQLMRSRFLAYAFDNRTLILSGLDEEGLRDGEGVIRKLCGELTASSDIESGSGRRVEVITLKDRTSECLHGAVERE